MFWDHQTLTFEAHSVVAAPGVLPDAVHLSVVLPRVLAMLRHGVSSFSWELEFAGIARAAG